MRKSQDEILKDFRLRSTTSRSAILDLFIHNDHALSYSDIEKEVAAAFDRVTVYRTLKTFLDKGVVHKVLDDGGSLKYALCNDHCSSAEHHHDHVHFKCTKCGQTNCLDEVEVPALKLPKGFQANEINLLIQGLCNKCQ
ncbi:MAG TPA: Fur family transcriptional regulator [Cyclobacteriaceae bacterium]